MSSCSERKTELRRRQKRRMQVARLKKRMAKATKSEKAEIARKLRDMTPGAEVLISSWGLAEVDREAPRLALSAPVGDTRCWILDAR